ncbi:MAG: site-specific integrase, partial [Nostocoides sp.]
MSKRNFGQITRLPSKRYRARYTGPDTALHNAPNTFDTSEDAQAWLTDERRLISAGTWSAPA